MVDLEARDYRILNFESNKHQFDVGIAELHDVQVDSLKEHQNAIMELKKRISALEESIALAENRFKKLEDE